MKNKRILAVIMTALLLVTSCIFVHADSMNEAEQGRGPITQTGTYNNLSYTFSVAGSSRTLIKARGDYAEEISMMIKYVPQFGYYNMVNNLVSVATGVSNTIQYGTYYDSSIGNSYTPWQALHEIESNNNLPYNYFANLLPSGTIFRYCSYTLYFDYISICNTSRTYAS